MSSKLKAISAADQQIRSLQNDLAQLDGDIKSKIAQLPDRCSKSSSIELNRYSHSIRERLTQFDNKVAEFDQLVQQKQSKKGAQEEKDTATMVSMVDRYRSESQNNLQNLRRATLSVMQAIEKNERQQLFHRQSPENESNVRQRQGVGLAGQSSELTESLTALVKHMDTQVRQSEATLTALVGSSQSLGETESEFKDMGATIKSSGKLLSKYGRREITDKLLIFLALLFFFGCCVYIVKKRFLGHFF